MAENLDDLRARAEGTLRKLSFIPDDETLATAKGLVEALRDLREYPTMGRLAEAVSRVDPKDPKNRRLYAQYLIEEGKATAAADVLRALTRRLPTDHPEHAEATGLLGRVYKQIFFDAGDKTSVGAREALKQAIEAYRKPFEASHTNIWHGVNLVALVYRARRLGLRVAPDLSPAAVAKAVVAALEATPASTRDEWYLPTLAEAQLGLGDYDAVERTIRQYAATDDAKPFLIASTLRQFTQVWNIESESERGAGIVAALRAQLLRLPGGNIEMTPDEVRQARAAAPPAQLEAILGQHGARTYSWWKQGLDRALSVAAVRQRLGDRIGSGFLVRGAEIGFEPGNELLLMTNFHVVNQAGANEGIPPDRVEIVFEAAHEPRPYLVDRIVWSSPLDRHDATVLRLQDPITGIEPLPIARGLPVVEPSAVVYIIGHPGGRDLAFSCQDNELLDHEGPPGGKRQIPGVSRVHYRAPTEGGSSGSPVFNADLWQVIALHHKGGKTGLQKLNDKPGTYAANEGISIQSIRDAVKDDRTAARG
jgi:tetratricopeptide (TPR) repeat protein